MAPPAELTTAPPAGAEVRPLARRRSLRRFLRLPSWLALLLPGMAIGYLVYLGEAFTVGGMMAIGLLLLSLHRPQAFVFIAIAVSPLSGLVRVEWLEATFRLPEYAWWLSALGILTQGLLGRQKLIISKATVALGVYAAFFVVSALWATNSRVSLREGIQFLTFPLMFFVVENALRTPRQLEKAVKLFLIGCAILLLGTLISNLFVHVMPSLRVSGGGMRLVWTGTYYNIVATSTYAGAVSLIAIALLLSGRGSRERRFALALFLILSFGLQAAALTRIELVGMVVGGVLLFSFYGWKRVLLFVAVAGITGLSTLTLLSEVRQKFEEVGKLESSTKWHYILPVVGWEIFKESPVFGSGAGAFEYKSQQLINRLGVFEFELETGAARFQPHDIIIQIGLETGIIGLTLFGWFLFITLRAIWRGCAPGRSRLSWQQHLCRGALAAIVLEFIVALVQNPQHWSPFWFIIALGYRAARMVEEAERAGTPRTPLERWNFVPEGFRRPPRSFPVGRPVPQGVPLSIHAGPIPGRRPNA